MDPTSIKKVLNTTVWILIAAALGFCCIAVPAWLSSGGVPETYSAPLCPAVGSAMKNIVILPTAVALFVLGSTIGFLKPDIWWLSALSAVAVFPACTLIELALFPKSHNLWPLEFAIVGLIDTPAFLGAFFGSRIRERRRRGQV